MEKNIDKLILEAKNGDTKALMEIIEYFDFTIKNLTRNERKESQKDYKQMLISELTIQVYKLDENKVKNKKAYLQACLKNYFIKINKWSKVDLNIEDTSEPFELDNYEIYENNHINEYLKVLGKFLNKRQLQIFKMRIIDNRSVKDISEFYCVSQNDIYKILKNTEKKVSNNRRLKEMIINEFLYT